MKGSDWMNKKLKRIAIPVVLVFLLVACTPIENDNEENNSSDAANESIIASLEEEVEELKGRNEELEQALEENGGTDEENSDMFIAKTLEVMELIKDKDFESLSDYVGEEGLLFSPYGHVEVENSVVLSAEEVGNLNSDEGEYEWGSYDGTGEGIISPFDEYYDEFIYDQDFLNPEIIGNNVRIGEGNTLENIHEVFEDSQYVEFHFTGFNEEFEGMDWVSLRLVFTESGESWDLVAIVHDQWTI